MILLSGRCDRDPKGLSQGAESVCRLMFISIKQRQLPFEQRPPVFASQYFSLSLPSPTLQLAEWRQKNTYKLPLFINGPKLRAKI